MIRKILMGFVLGLIGMTALAMAGCSAPVADGANEQRLNTPPATTRAAASDAASAINAFGIDLYKLQAQEPGNVFLSPLSIELAFGTLLAGAEGQTREEIASTLRLPAGDDAVHAELGELADGLERTQDGVTLSIANALWVQRDFAVEAPFLATARENYGARVDRLDLAGDPVGSSARINAWVSDETRGRIPTLIAPEMLTPLSRVVITNAVYFLGDWAQPFQPNATHDEPFHLAGGDAEPAAMMHARLRVPYLDGDGFQAIAMPYKDDQLEMVVLLPDERDGIGELEADLTENALAEWMTKLDNAEPRDVRVSFPKAELRTSMALIPLMQRLGMKDVFEESKADLSGINREVQLYVSAAIHKTFLKIDETGTEAAAATGIVVTAVSAPPPMPEFRADHPFWFAIRDRTTGAMLFMGRMSDPEG